MQHISALPVSALTGAIRVPIATFEEVIGILADFSQRFDVRKAGALELSYAGRKWTFIRDAALTEQRGSVDGAEGGRVQG